MKKLTELLPTQFAERKSLELPKWLLEKSKAIIERYGTAQEFTVSFNPDIQVNCAANVERSLTGEAPTVRQLLATYTHKQMAVWLMGHFENLNVFVGVKLKMEYEQMVMLADIILTEYPYLKASEVLLFFHQYKSGNHGELYSSVDPMKVTVALHSFLKWRAAELDKIKARRLQEDRERKRAEWTTTGITREEYEKKQNENKADKQKTSE